MNRAWFFALCATVYATPCATGCTAPFENPDLVRVGPPITPEAPLEPTTAAPVPAKAATSSTTPTAPVVGATPSGPRTLALSVEDAIVRALTQNRDLRVRQFGPVIAGTFEQLERATFDPELFAETTFDFDRSSETNRATGNRFDVEGTGSNSRVGLRQRFSTGTDIEAAVEHRLDDSDRTPQQQVARVALTVTQALLRGRGSTVNLVRVHQAQIEAEISMFELRAFTQAILAESEIAYWQFALAREEIQIFENALAVASEERSQIEVRIEVGQLPELEIAAARAEEARREQALIDARSRLEAARLRLARLVNPTPGGRLETAITTTSDPRIRPAAIRDSEARLSLAEKYRPDLGEARLRIDQNRLQVVASKNGLLPQLDVFVRLRKTGFGGDFTTAVENIADANTYDVRAGLTLSQFLLNRAEAASVEAARASRRQAEAALDNLVQLAHFEVRLALNELERARALISASTETRRLQEKAVAAVKERFSVGVGTALAVAQAQRDLLESQIAEIRSVVDYRRALVELYRAEGTLLDRRGVSIGPPIDPLDLRSARSSK